MVDWLTKYFELISQKYSMRRWVRATKDAPQMEIASLRATRTRAQALSQQLEQVIHIADSRLMLPMIGADAMQQPADSDWAYRPEIWRGPVSPSGVAAAPVKTAIGNEAVVFHDCKISELTLRQVRNTRKDDLAPFGLQLDVFKFDGSFLSVVLNLPDEALRGFHKKHLLRIDAIVEMEQPSAIYARLNIKHGPNTEQVVRELPLDQDVVMVEFDLAYTKISENRIERLWIDLIFENPQMNQITLRDITFSRRIRAEL